MSDDGGLDGLDAAVDRLLREFPPGSTAPQRFLEAQFDLGLAWVHHPVGAGGRGASCALQAHVDGRLAAVDAPRTPGAQVIGKGMAAPVLMQYGTAVQQQRYLRPIFSGEEIWCQLFSEPGAGSDIAGLAANAVRDGDTWVVNGQKVWTSLGHVARFGLLVARTDATVPKHRGLTFFVCDMHAPGVEVRPLRQLTGDAEFNEVFLSDVEIADDQRLGDVGNGWAVVLATLMNERATLGTASQATVALDALLDAWTHADIRPPAYRDRIARLWSEVECLRLMSARRSGGAGGPGAEASLLKLGTAELGQRILDTLVTVLGAAGMLVDSYEMHRPEQLGLVGPPTRMFLRSVASTIEGGTSNVQRNIIAERVLGLPGDVRVDRDVPWLDVLRG